MGSCQLSFLWHGSNKSHQEVGSPTDRAYENDQGTRLFFIFELIEPRIKIKTSAAQKKLD